MVWTAPSTKTTASTFSTSEWNTYVRDNLAAVVERPTVGLSDSRTATADYVLASGTTYPIHWYDEDWDSHGAHSTSSNRSRITAPTGWGGVWLIVASVTVSGADYDGYRRARIIKNGATTYAESEQTPASGKSRTTVHVAAFVDLAVTDYVEVDIGQTSGSTLQLLGNLDDDELGCTCQAIYWGDTTSSTDVATLAGWNNAASPAAWWNLEGVASFTRLRSRPVARAFAAATSVADKTWVSLTFASETFDNAAMHNTGANTERITATTAGLHIGIAQVSFNPGTVGNRQIRWRLNGSATATQSQSQALPSDGLSLQTVIFQNLEIGDYLDVQFRHEQGSSINVSGWVSAGWAGALTPVTGAQRLTADWSDDAYAGGGQAGIVPRSWIDVHTRDLPGMTFAPPAVSTKARFTRDITPGEWKKIKFNRQQYDTWDTVKGVRNFGEKYVIPRDGIYATGCQINIKDDSVVSAKFTVPTTAMTVNTGTDVCTATAHGLRSGGAVYLGTTTTLPAGLDNQELFAHYLTDNTFTLHEYRRQALRNTNIIDITSTGAGTHTVSRSIVECRGLNLRHGTKVRVSSSGTLPSGLASNTDYWVIRQNINKFRLAPTEAFAAGGEYTPITDSGSGTHTLTVQEPYGSRGVRLVHSGEVQGGWLGQPAPSFETSRPAVSLIAAKAGDELWVEAITTGPEGSRITAESPSSRWWTVWLGPWAYTGALAMADRPLT